MQKDNPNLASVLTNSDSGDNTGSKGTSDLSQSSINGITIAHAATNI